MSTALVQSSKTFSDVDCRAVCLEAVKSTWPDPVTRQSILEKNPICTSQLVNKMLRKARFERLLSKVSRILDPSLAKAYTSPVVLKTPVDRRELTFKVRAREQVTLPRIHAREQKRSIASFFLELPRHGTS